MNDERPVVVIVPTELERTDGFYDLAVLFGAGLAVWWLALEGVPIWWIAPWTIPLAIWVLTGEAAADVPFLGAIAVGLRNKCGLRRAHEWVLAGLYFWNLAVRPVWEARCVAFYHLSRRRITRLRQQTSAAIRLNHSRACSWASATRCSLSFRLGRSTR